MDPALIHKKFKKEPDLFGSDRDVSYYIFDNLKCPECQNNTAFVSIELIEEYYEIPIIITACSTKNCIFRTELLKTMKKELYSLDMTWDEYLEKYQAQK